MNKKGLALLKTSSIAILLIVILIALSLFAFGIGSAGYSIKEIVTALLDDSDNTIKTVVINLRMPRVFMAILIGSALATAGALMQAVMRNPLADPGMIGVSTGAATAATTVILLYPNITSAVPVFAFGGALLSFALIYLLAWHDGVDPVRLILSGVAINSVLGAYTAMLQLLNSDSLAGVLAFLNGSLSGRSWSKVSHLSIYVGVGLILAFLCIKSANIMQLGDEMAKSLGFNVGLNRLFLSMVSAFLAAATVSFVGLIGFVGLVVPHMSRMLVGSDYKHLLPISAILGSVVLLLADTLGRNMVYGMEIPVGIVMAVTGGPFFLYMLRKRKKISVN